MACAGRGLDLDARARPTTAGCKLDPRRAFATSDRVLGRCVEGRSRRLLAVLQAAALTALCVFSSGRAVQVVRYVRRGSNGRPEDARLPLRAVQSR